MVSFGAVHYSTFWSKPVVVNSQRWVATDRLSLASTKFGFVGDGGGSFDPPSLLQVAEFLGVVATAVGGLIWNNRWIAAKEYKKFLDCKQREDAFKLANPEPMVKEVSKSEPQAEVPSEDAPARRRRKSQGAGGAMSLLSKAIGGELLGYW